MFISWIPETLGTILNLLGTMSQKEWLRMTELPGFWQLFASAYQLLGLAWHLLLVPMAVATAERLRWWQATIVGTLTVTIVGFIMLIFIR